MRSDLGMAILDTKFERFFLPALGLTARGVFVSRICKSAYKNGASSETP